MVNQVHGHTACAPAAQKCGGIAVPLAKCMAADEVTRQAPVAIRAIPTPSRSLAGMSMREATHGFIPSTHSAQAPAQLTSIRCTPRSCTTTTPRSPCSSSWAPPRMMHLSAQPSLTPPLVATPMKSWKPHPVAQIVSTPESRRGEMERSAARPMQPIQSQSWVPPCTPRRELPGPKSWIPPAPMQMPAIQGSPITLPTTMEGVDRQAYSHKMQAPWRMGASAGFPAAKVQALERVTKRTGNQSQVLSHCPSLVIDQRCANELLRGCQTMVAEPYQELKALPASMQARSHVLPPCPSLVACPVYAANPNQRKPRQPEGPQTLQIASAFNSRQHPAKMSTGIPNADAVLEGIDYVGIADGVSGVHALGLTPDALPWELLRYCGKGLFAAAAKGEPKVKKTEKHEKQMGEWLINLIQEAFDFTEEHGATTLLLAAIKGNDLVTACLGDSGILILRPVSYSPLRLQPIFKTEPGRFDARRPVQIQRLHGCDVASAHEVISSANVGTTPVRPGDFLILGTDGLFDNLSDKQIKDALEHFYYATEAQGSNEELCQVATLLVDLAIRSVKLDKENADKPPWQCNGAVPANNADDTTALVAMIKTEGCTSESSPWIPKNEFGVQGRVALAPRLQVS